MHPHTGSATEMGRKACPEELENGEQQAQAKRSHLTFVLTACAVPACGGQSLPCPAPTASLQSRQVSWQQTEERTICRHSNLQQYVLCTGQRGNLNCPLMFSKFGEIWMNVGCWWWEGEDDSDYLSEAKFNSKRSVSHPSRDSEGFGYLDLMHFGKA